MIASVQTPVDAWTMLYSEIGMALSQRFGAAGRGVLRQSVRDYAGVRGRRRRQELEQAGYSVNLKSLFSVHPDFPQDHRLKSEYIRLEDQRLFANVAYCPMAALWKDSNCSELGTIYCEEFYHAYVKGALFSRCQVNVTQTLTYDWDNICRFSFYLRPANLEQAQREACFGGKEIVELD